MKKPFNEIPIMVMRRSYWAFWNLWLTAFVSIIFFFLAEFLADIALDFISDGGRIPTSLGFSTVYLVIQASTVALTLFSIFNIIYMRFYSTYTVYSDRMQVSHGILSRNVSSIYMEHIRSVDIKKTLAGMILGYGNLYIGTSGTSENNITMLDIEEPMNTKQTILDIRDGNYTAPSTDDQSTSTSSQDPQKPSPANQISSHSQNAAVHVPYVNATFHKPSGPIKDLSSSFINDRTRHVSDGFHDSIPDNSSSHQKPYVTPPLDFDDDSDLFPDSTISREGSADFFSSSSPKSNQKNHLFYWPSSDDEHSGSAGSD